MNRHPYSLSVASLLEGQRTLREYQLDGIPTIGVFGEEPFQIQFRNSSSNRVQVRLSIDGRDVLTGQQASLEPHGKMWVVEPYQVLPLAAWPEDNQGGAAFVFTHAGNAVAMHTPGDLNSIGYISAAVFVEGYVPPPVYRPNYSGGAVSRGGDRSLESLSLGDPIAKGGPGVGAGERVQQNIRSVRGLHIPVYSQLLQVRYLWWDRVAEKLQQAGFQATPGHPTGFSSEPLANIGNAPRLPVSGTPAHPVYPPAQTGYSRFA